MNATNEDIRATLNEREHVRYLVCSGRIEELEDVVARDPMPDLIAGNLVEDEDAEPKPEGLPDGSIQFDGAAPIAEAAAILEWPLMAEGGEYTTIAGFVLWRLGHIPNANEAFGWEGWRFVVAALEEHRIETVSAHPVAEQI